MSYVSQETVWPEAVALDDGVKDVITLFYQLADDTGKQAGPRMANEVFAEDGKLVLGAGVFVGRDEIARCRDHAWGKITARRHKIQQIFVNDKQGNNLFLLGSAKLDLANGKTVESDYAAHILVNAQSKAGGKPRLESLQVFADSAPVMNALKGD